MSTEFVKMWPIEVDDQPYINYYRIRDDEDWTEYPGAIDVPLELYLAWREARAQLDTLTAEINKIRYKSVERVE